MLTLLKPLDREAKTVGWIGLDWIELDWIGLGLIGLDWGVWRFLVRLGCLRVLNWVGVFKGFELGWGV